MGEIDNRELDRMLQAGGIRRLDEDLPGTRVPVAHRLWQPAGADQRRPCQCLDATRQSLHLRYGEDGQ